MSDSVRVDTEPAQVAAAVPGYALGSSPAERDRLRRQADDLRPHSVTLLDQLGAMPGWSAIDLGCGPGGVIELLSARVGPGGRVTGLDFDPGHVSLARALAADRGLANVKIMQADARRTGLPSSSFDLVHARLLLVNIPEPAQVVAEMARLARPGGWVASQEADVIALCHPPLAAWDRLAEISFRRLPPRRGQPAPGPAAA